MRELREIVREWERHRGHSVALATLVRTTGSSYRRPGARMLVARDGSTVGSLSAGCLEDEVALVALEVLRTGAPQLLRFDTRRRFGCSGTIEIFVERAPNHLLGDLDRALLLRQSCAVETTFEGDAFALGSRVVAIDTAMREGAFVQKIEPVIRLVIVGEGADARALQDQAACLRWDAHWIESVAAWDVIPDARTAAVIATHNYGRDCAALRHLLPLPLRYVGLIGPRRRRDEVLSDVLDCGAKVLAKLFAPAGLHLGAEGAPEIALSICAEIQAVFAHASVESLRDRRAPIHEPAVAQFAESTHAA